MSIGPSRSCTSRTSASTCPRSVTSARTTIPAAGRGGSPQAPARPARAHVVVDRDLRAVGGEQLRRLRADPAARAGHDRHLVPQQLQINRTSRTSAVVRCVTLPAGIRGPPEAGESLPARETELRLIVAESTSVSNGRYARLYTPSTLTITPRAPPRPARVGAHAELAAEEHVEDHRRRAARLVADLLRAHLELLPVRARYAFSTCAENSRPISTSASTGLPCSSTSLGAVPPGDGRRALPRCRPRRVSCRRARARIRSTTLSASFAGSKTRGSPRR